MHLPQTWSPLTQHCTAPDLYPHPLFIGAETRSQSIPFFEPSWEWEPHWKPASDSNFSSLCACLQMTANVLYWFRRYKYILASRWICKYRIWVTRMNCTQICGKKRSGLGVRWWIRVLLLFHNPHSLSLSLYNVRTYICVSILSIIAYRLCILYILVFVWVCIREKQLFEVQSQFVYFIILKPRWLSACQGWGMQRRCKMSPPQIQEYSFLVR